MKNFTNVIFDARESPASCTPYSLVRERANSGWLLSSVWFQSENIGIFFVKILALVTNIWQISQQALLVASVTLREGQGGRMNRSSPSHLPVFSSALKVDGTKSALTTDMASSERNCRLNDKFGLLVQGILAAVAFSTLICKWRSIIGVQCEILMDNFRPFL